VLTAALAAVAAIAGATGTWSPCGFSMIETIGGPRRRVGASCGAFTAGAVAGGAATFGCAALLGRAAHGSAGRAAVLAAVAVAVAAAVAESRGAAVAPQIRRQVPEHWRRALPLPLAAALYGVLLGLALTTFVLTFAVWALAAVTFALGEPRLGLVVGISFGVGRALPVVTIAPLVHRRLGIRMCAAMAERPRILRALRVADAFALLLAAAALVTADARAATRLGVGTDPSAAGGAVVWTTPTGGVQIREGQAGATGVPSHSVLGGSLIAWPDGDTVHVANVSDMSPVVDVAAAGVDAIAVSDRWLVTRTTGGGFDTLSAIQLSAPTQARTLATARSPTQLGRPALDGDLVVYHVASGRASRIVEYDLARSTSRVLRSSASALLTNPSLLAGWLLYAQQTSLAQLLQLGPAAPGGRDRALYRLAAPARHDSGHERGHSTRTRTPHPRTAQWTLWTSALSATRAYVTLLPRRRGAQPMIVAVPR
jgi:hypothetical protein